MATDDEIGVKLKLEGRQKFSNELRTAEGDVNAFGRSIRSTFADIRNSAEMGLSAFRGSLSVIGSLLRTTSIAVLGLSTAVGVLGGAFVTFGLKTAGSLEQANIAFTTMLGSGEKAQEFLNDLKKFAATTPFEFPEVVDSAKKMLAFGWDAKRVIPDLTAIGNAISGVGGGSEGMQRVILALGQMRMKGKVQGDEMLQLAEANINAWGYLAKALGKTTAETQKMASEGLIPAEKAIDAITTGLAQDPKFIGLMAKQSKSLFGLWSNFKDVVGLGSAAAMQPLVDELKYYLPGATVAAQKALERFGKGSAKSLRFFKEELAPTMRVVYEKFAVPLTALLRQRMEPTTAKMTQHLREMMRDTQRFSMYFNQELTSNNPSIMGGFVEGLEAITGNTGKFERLRISATGLFRDLSSIYTNSLKPAFDDLATVFPSFSTTMGLLRDAIGFMADHPDAGKVFFEGMALAIIATGLSSKVAGIAVGLERSYAAMKLFATTGAIGGASSAGGAAAGAGGVASSGPFAAFIAGGLTWTYVLERTMEKQKQWRWEIGLLAQVLVGVPGMLALTISFIRDLATNTERTAKGFQKLKDVVRGAIESLKSLPSWFGGVFDISKLGQIGSGGIKGMASGGVVTSGGTALVGERGPELISASPGATVRPLQGPEAKVSVGGGVSIGQLIISGADALHAERIGEIVIEQIKTQMARA